MLSGETAVWVRCAVDVAATACRAGRVSIGCTKPRIVPAKMRPPRCYRYLGYGHTRLTCKAPPEFGDRCYKYSKTGHKVAVCQAVAWCILCAKNHRTRGPECTQNVGGDVRVSAPHILPDGGDTLWRLAVEDCRIAYPTMASSKAKIIQTNNNRSRLTQDLLIREAMARGCRLAVIAEPNSVPKHLLIGSVIMMIK